MNIPWPALKISGRWISNAMYATYSNGTFALAANTQYYHPIIAPFDVTVTQAAFWVTTAGAAGKLARIGVYDSNPLTGRPGKVLAQASGVPVDGATGARTQAFDGAASVALVRGMQYWLSIHSDGTPTLRKMSGSANVMVGSMNTGAVCQGWLKYYVYSNGTLETPNPSLSTTHGDNLQLGLVIP